MASGKDRLVMEPGGCFPVYNIEFQLQIAGQRSGVTPITIPIPPIM